jgi:hypothetical protein
MLAYAIYKKAKTSKPAPSSPPQSNALPVPSQPNGQTPPYQNYKQPQHFAQFAEQPPMRQSIPQTAQAYYPSHQSQIQFEKSPPRRCEACGGCGFQRPQQDVTERSKYTMNEDAQAL